MVKKLKFHELCELFPLMTEEELDLLAEDIKENGLLEPILLYHGTILDGRNRYLACQRAGVAPEFEELETDDPMSYVIGLNLHRRHLTSGQKAVLAVRLIKPFEERAAARRDAQLRQGETIPDQENLPEREGQARDQVAELVGVNPRYVSDAKRVQTKNPKAFIMLEKGEINMREAIALADKSQGPKPIKPDEKVHPIFKDTERLIKRWNSMVRAINWTEGDKEFIERMYDTMEELMEIIEEVRQDATK